MLTPDKFKELTNNNTVVEMYTKLNQDLTNEIIKKIKQSGDISSYTRHQMKVLIKNGGKSIFSDALIKTQRLTSRRKREVANLFEDLLNESYSGYDKTYELKDKEFEISAESIEVVNSIVKLTNKELNNLTRSIAFKTQKEYTSAMDELYKKVISGGWSYDKAIKSTILDLTDKGVMLKSKGKNYTIEARVRNGLFDALKKTANKISSQIKDDIDANCVIIGHSTKCRPTHHVIDDVKMSIELFENKYEYLTEEYNCNHIVRYDWLPEFENKKSKVDYGEERLNYKENLEAYKKQQKQNYLARQVRQKKKEVASIKNSSKEVLKEKRIQLRNAQMKYRIFSKANGLNVDYSQTWQAGYNGNR